MMMKFLLLIVLMFFALGLAAILLQRMARISQRIAELQNDMKKNQVRIESQVQVLEEKQKSAAGETPGISEWNDVEEKNS